MNRSTTGKGSRSRLVWNDEFDGRGFKVPTELCGENSSTHVMLGQGILPEQYHPLVNMMDDAEQRFIDHYCKAARA